MSRAVVITGASTGIGRSCALYLDTAGWQVFAGVRKEADGDSLAAEGSNRLTPVMIDVADQASIDAALKQVTEAVGTRLEGLVNNAGISMQGPIEHIPLDDLRKQLEVNVTGQVAVTQAFLPMIREAKGRVVLIGSIGGRTPSAPFIGAYTASKFALEAIADSLRQEMRPAGVHVSIVEPGTIVTPLWDKGVDNFDEDLAKIPQHHHAYYEPAMHKARAIATKLTKTGISPDVVAKKVEHALTSTRPKTRYLVGKDAYARAYLETLMPDKARDRLIDRMFFKK